MKRLIFSTLVLSGMTANAQVKNGMVGINTDEPRATMHIEPGVSESKGLIIPRITAAQMKTMTSLAHFGADHHAIITYLKEDLPVADCTGKLEKVDEAGYYFYNHTAAKWQKFGGGGAEQDLRMVGSNNHLTKDAGVGSNGTSLGSGMNNIGIGQDTFDFANSSDMTGNNNIGMGYSLYSLTSGNMNGASNIGIGSNSYTIVNGDMATNANNNIALGNSIYRLSNSSTSTFSGANNIGIGNTLYNLPLGNLTGQRNIGMGDNVFSVAAGDLSGNDNIAIGTGAMQADAGIIGGNNIALGTNAMTTGTSNNKLVGSNNIAIGNYALYTNGGDILGSYNIGIGNRVLEGHMGRGGSNIHIGNKYPPTVPYIPGHLNEVVAIGNKMHPLSPATTNNNVILLGSNKADSPKIGMGIYKPQAKLDVAGGVRVANDTSACTSANGGTIRYDGTNFYGCTSSGWKQLNN